MKKSFYYQTIVPCFLQANVTSKDKINNVLDKLDSIKAGMEVETLESIKAFVRDHWDTEKKVIMNSCNNIPPMNSKEYFTDPVMEESILVVTPKTKYVKYGDVMFPRCGKCSGRIYKHFAFCPYCGMSVKDTDTQSIVLPSLSDNRLKRRFGGVNSPGISPVRSSSEISASGSDVFVEDADVRVTKADVSNALRNVKKYMP